MESRDPGARRHFAIFASCLLALGLHATGRVLLTGQPLKPLRNWRILTTTKGYCYDQYFAKVFPHFDGGIAEKLELVEGFREDARAWLRADAAANLFGDVSFDPAGGCARAKEIARARGTVSEADYALGFGPLLVRCNHWSHPNAVAAVAAGDPEVRTEQLEALGRFGGGNHPLHEFLYDEIGRGLGLERGEPYLRGVGRWLYRRYRIDPEAAATFIETLPVEARAPLYEGYTAEREWHLLND